MWQERSEAFSITIQKQDKKRAIFSPNFQMNIKMSRFEVRNLRMDSSIEPARSYSQASEGLEIRSQMVIEIRALLFQFLHNRRLCRRWNHLSRLSTEEDLVWQENKSGPFSGPKIGPDRDLMILEWFLFSLSPSVSSPKPFYRICMLALPH